MTNLKNFTVIASGKMRDVAYAKLNETVNLLGWQKQTQFSPLVILK